MFMHPTTRKAAITDPAQFPFLNYPDSVYVQDDQFLPESFSQDIPFQYLAQEEGLQSPFHYQQFNNFVSPPSSVPSSPSSSPASSVSHFPQTTAVGYPAVFDGASTFEAPSMTPASSYNPSIHVQHSGSPQPQSYLPHYQPQQFIYENSPMLTTNQYPISNNGWDHNIAPRVSHQYGHNLQTPSSSSGRSPGSYAHSSAPTKPLPTPVHTPIQNSFLTPQYRKNDFSHDASQFVPEQQQQSQHQHKSSDYSLAPSVSTASHNSPVTPQAGFEDVEDNMRSGSTGENRLHADRWLDDYLQFDPADYNNSQQVPLAIPKLNRTITDIYQDELFDPTAVQTPQVQKQPEPQQQQQQHLAPYNLVANRLQAANQGHMSARVQSPVGSIHRERSPFRQDSPMATEYGNHDAFQQNSQITSIPTSQPGMVMRQAQAEPKTISPQDAVLHDLNETPDHGLPMFSHQPDFNIGDALGLRHDQSFQAPGFPSMDSFPGHYNQAGTSHPFTFNQQQQGRRQSQQYLHHTPDFPASMPRFESTGSDVYSNNLTSPPLSKNAVPIQHEITRPQDTTSDSGTYTCTYHGCSQRFDTPPKLQKHKREAHRQTTPGGHMGVREGMSRNTQAGPHRCERKNPSTGKPCNSVFSRPYDLTRHEDTIHNARKQKVRCSMCTEEKTFSRNDALTRHMRVVHPDVDWPGKQRRRGRE
ncbi:hypothetical protein BJX99DRAFT_61721 [Aspergillus californicus]